MKGRDDDRSETLSGASRAFRAGLHRNYIGAIERGEINPTFRVLLKLEGGLTTPLSELVARAQEIECVEFGLTFARTSDEEVHELYRNGIVHGMLVNFNNPVVATKAWNRLFAVADWAASLERGAAPPEPEPSWRELIEKIRRNAEMRRALDEWRPQTLTEDDAAFETDPLYLLTDEFLDAWIRKNYGAMASKLASLVREKTQGATAGRVREDFSLVGLTEYKITRLDFQAMAACEVDVELTWMARQDRAGFAGSERTRMET